MLHTVAKLHYEAEMSQVDIARQLGVSTATISRLLQRARAEGIVRIEVLDLAAPEEITGQLIDRLGLRDAAVVETPAAGALTALAGPLGGLLKQAQLVAGSVVAIGWGRAVREVIRAGLPRIPGVLTVAATGGMQQHAAHFQVNEFVRLAAEEFGGIPHFIHAPYLPSSELREVFLGDAAISDAVALWDRTDVAIVGIGLPHAINAPEASAATPSEQALVHAAGDVLRHYFDADGALIAWEGEGRMIAMSPAQLRAVPLVIGVAASPEKATAIIGAARARLINAVITDTKTAQAILATLPPR
ncbi:MULTISPECIES: sugar-binding domain-containing protein [unclassified Mesorhizobium]|uniref:sugar-binding transcriptional regulator n=1 Tax=unclassified Mesorhizobium TaxID=325217 RepID=UPI001126E88D|nr:MULTISPECIES: sugar-binding domain-containing protein [unclassified Mesorhizobium]TPJ42071.1 helix-turn-helix domain-containing protein [Mesorhizobium sp. B2-6-6]MBZ9959494.1 helix-turn-helix domain-containing protein [Mesorhizobium sp. BR1-1-14]MBZ9999476.1 helix-turn-helix domain-containing protein [Mesorhizobium sp. B264B2A]MCA0007950.1 helix-turn-helix domain-containing protein [Mesorhizobium sp. B264B1B]MCA0022761.1 helix-turn-helix domain-containing protein [Mesorhizobium sp. B264B1A]